MLPDDEILIVDLSTSRVRSPFLWFELGGVVFVDPGDRGFREVG